MDIKSYILGYQKGKAQNGGTSNDDLAEVDAYLDAINGGSVHLVTFVGDDGKTLCILTVPHGDDCPDPIDTQLISKPTKSNTLTYAYTFMGWSSYKGGNVNDNALKNITENRTLYTAFSSARIRGSCGGTSYWTISNDYTSLTICGNGELQRIDDEWWTDHIGTIKRVTFVNNDGTITALGDTLFGMNTVLESITIPDTVKSIGISTFYLTRGLKTITIPASVTSIGFQAFSASKLESATFESTSGWRASNSENTVNVSSAMLSQPSNAANELVNTYVNYTWTRAS